MKISQLLFKRAVLLSFTFLFLTISFSTVQAAGEVDPTFNASAYQASGSVLTTKLQSDGKLLVGGIFSVVNGKWRSSIARLNPDGTVDTSFNPPDLYDLNNTANPGNVYKIGLQSSGKILVGGSFGVTGSTTRSLIRLNTDGSLDTTFNNLAAQFGTTELIYEINIRPDDTIYISGYIEFDKYSSTSSSGIVRLDSNGVRDSTFQFARVSQVSFNVIKAFAVTADNTVYAAVEASGSPTTFGRYNSTGGRDTSFSPIIANAPILKIVIQPDGKLLLGGGFSTLNDFTQRGISRINPDGVIDTNFNSGNGTNSSGAVNDISLTPDGKIVIAGSFAGYQGIQEVAVARINSDGSRDTSFNSPFGTLRTATTVAVQSDGKIIIFAFNSYITPALQRLNTTGEIDGSYQPIFFGFKGGTVNDIVQQPDGKILAGGKFTFADASPILDLARYNSDGSVDSLFNQTFLTSETVVNKIALQSTGKILIGGNLVGGSNPQQVGVFRFNTNGSLDTTFAPYYPHPVTDLAVLSDNKILADVNGGVVKLLADGGIDNSFTSPNTAAQSTIAFRVQPDGKILIVGSFTQVNAVGRGRIARLNSDGSLDTTFAPPLGANNNVTGVELQTDGKIIVFGIFTGLNGDSTRAYIGRLNSDGSLDTGFAPTLNSAPLTAKVQPDGKVLIGGTFTTVNGVSRNRFARLNTDGTLDASFNIGSGANGVVNKITLQTDGKILLGGDFSRINGVSAPGIARLLNAAVAARTPFDFDGDGRADVSVFRPSNGVWYLNQSTNGFTGAAFGQSGDKLAPADYDGDGKTDLAVVRNGVWYIQRSSLGFTGLQFGNPDDIPVPADYDGDGKADVAVFRPSNGTWYLQQSTGGFSAVQLGVGTDKPVPGDYNGDGKAEVAVFRPSNGTWYLSTNPATGYGGVVFGASTDVLVPADYDGDGKTDLAVFRPSNGTWYIQRSTAGFIGVAFGLGTDIPVPADYDGDGKADIAVVRNGNWYLNRSTAGFTGITFGFSDDKPIPNSFVR